MKIDWRIINTTIWLLVLLILVSTAIYVTETAKEVNEMIYDNPNIDWYYNCGAEFISAHYNCPTPFQNITGKYCNDTIVCESSYRINEVGK